MQRGIGLFPFSDRIYRPLPTDRTQLMNLQTRFSGILMPLSSLPAGTAGGSQLGSHAFCGGLGASARRFADFLQCAGQSAWQMLPVNPIDECNSPYASVSTFAGDPLYIDLDDLVQEGLLSAAKLVPPETDATSFANYEKARAFREPLLKKAFERFRNGGGTKYHHQQERFLAENPWVKSHSEFAALSEQYGTADWTTWNVSGGGLFQHQSGTSFDFHSFLQLVFSVQWDEFHKYCSERGISLIGDVPIYVSYHSVAPRTQPELFQLDEHGKMLRVAGVPGDSFNPDGQRWDMPLYDWEQHKKTGYCWWKQRLGNALKRFDAVRLDHFIGFYNYFSMPPEHNPDDLGYWVPGPADDFFDAVLAEFPNAQLIAEDLGVMNQGVHKLRDKYHFPGINVFQFFWDDRENTDKTALWKVNSVVCTGTHDTNTLAGWIEEVETDDRSDKPVKFWDYGYLCGLLKPFNPPRTGDGLTGLNSDAIIRKVMSLPGNAAVFPMQDILGLPKEARMNFPGHAENNWLWRLDGSLLTDELADKLRTWTKEFGR
ncbi:MAG: 4-alpha-glucanotransferase [Planctomycetaceae bacterium]|nr:4-alpha-glucanotransferase [Planctomycetaceae bacterium]